MGETRERVWHEDDLAGMFRVIESKPPDQWTLQEKALLDYRDARAALAEEKRKREALEQRLAEAEESVEAQDIKLGALAPHGTCACSYDKVGDLCGHHSPQVQLLERKVADLEKRLEGRKG